MRGLDLDAIIYSVASILLILLIVFVSWFVIALCVFASIFVYAFFDDLPVWVTVIVFAMFPPLILMFFVGWWYEANEWLGRLIFAPVEFVGSIAERFKFSDESKKDSDE